MSADGPRIEELYEAPPIEIEMVGGYFDGLRMHVPDNRDTWHMPLPPKISLTSEPDVTTASIPVQRYRATGGIRDDGTRVFQAI